MRRITREFKCEIGDNLKDEKRDITIIGREYRQRIHTDGKSIINDKWYKYKCNKCGWDEGWVVESALLKQKQGCSCCSNRTVVEDINSIWVTDRWMCSLGLSEEDAKPHTKCSGDKVIVTCPKCNKKKEMRIVDIYKYKSIGCSCGDGFSYGHKYVYSMLKQNNIRFEDNVTFNWCKFKDYKKDKIRSGEYDFVIEDIKTIIEVDNWKDEQHLLHGLKTIRIDCFKSNIEYIRGNILKSELNKIFDLSKIDWLKCEEFAINSNKVKEVCDYWNNDKKDWETTADLEKIFKMSRDTIISYLKKGMELGWCNYSGKEEQGRNGRRNGGRCGKTVGMYNLEGNFIMKESSAVKLKERCLKELNINLDTGNISNVCLGRLKKHKGYIFKYID